MNQIVKEQHLCYKQLVKMNSNFVLLVDVGNTSICLGIGYGRRVCKINRLDSVGCTAKVVENAITKVIQGRQMHGAVLCSVVPGLTDLWSNEIKKACNINPMLIHHRLKLDVKIDYPRPGTIGADRLANACGAVSRYGVPVIVADFGTALTFDVISRNRKYIGGVIAPGLSFMTDYLAEKTALLPRIELKGQCLKIGRSTAGAMRIGAKVGYRGMVREIVEHVKTGLGLRQVKLCATGGYARWILEELDMPFTFDPNLTLYGLSRIYELNVKSETPPPAGQATPLAW